jgi:SAM-dependent methyltransferase
MYQCVVCTEKLIAESNTIQSCPQCGSHYPVVNGIPVFIPDAFVVLNGYLQELAEIKHRLTETTDHLEKLQKTLKTTEFSERIERNISAIQADIDILEEPYLPIRDSLQDDSVQDDVLSWGMVKAGANFYDMLPYFYQDWNGTPDFEKASEKICLSITEHCVDRQTVAVLGTAACGMLYKVSALFETAHGVDLSLPLLLKAKSFINGKPLEFFYLPSIDGQKISVTPPKHTTNSIQFLTADVNTLPFADESQSVVITQYLIDIMGDSARFAQEIRRVLKPDGLWINFSKPFRAVEDPLTLGVRRLAELPPLFKRWGFDVIELSNERFNFLNMTAIAPEDDLIQHAIHYFVLKKDSSAPVENVAKPINRFFIPNEAIWNEIPRLVKDKELTFSKSTSFDGAGNRYESQYIHVKGRLALFIPAEVSILLETLFSAVNSQRNLRELFNILHDTFNLDQKYFLKLIYILTVPHHLLDV